MPTIKNQRKTYGPRPCPEYTKGATITATVRHDDACGNGHNTFSITGEIREPGRGVTACGQLHEYIAPAFPELAPLIKWHLTSTDGPLHYVANTLYWLGYSGFCDGKPTSPPNLEYARSTAVWPDMPEELLATCPDAVAPAERAKNVATMLQGRLPMLLANFRAAVESLGFIY